MPYPIENKLVIAVASSALFNLIESDGVFKTQGESVYREYQENHLDIPFEKGVAFPFILGGIDKAKVLNILKPHIFFDDQMVHLNHIDKIPAVHIPFGIANK